MKNSRILIVDDEISIRESLSEALENQHYHIDLVPSAEKAISKISSSSFNYNLVLTDLKMQGMSGDKLLLWIKKNSSKTDVIIFTAYATIENAVQAIKNGAADYINKPIDLFKLRKMIQNILERQNLIEENLALKKQLKSKEEIFVTGNSSVIMQVYEMVDKVADTDATVLIEGASGTGKELVAQALHHRSSRKNKPFITVNCGALPDNLLENELFGHEKEAFTGAVTQKKGRFEQANGGTLFLDEISEMSLESQSGLLRVLEDGCFHRVGGSDLIQVDVRIVSASNQNLLQACKDGKFRSDLYYRLHVVPISIPLLKDRKEDIPVLISHFLDELSIKYDRLNLEIDSKTIEYFREYSWPGNVRELKNVLERAVILCKDQTIDLSCFPTSMQQETVLKANTKMPVFGNSLLDMEKIMILETLENVNGHRKRAAEILGISVRTLQYKIKDYQLDK